MVGAMGKWRGTSPLRRFGGRAALRSADKLPLPGAGGKFGCPGASGRKNHDATDAHCNTKLVQFNQEII